jgi:hypothetical protein
MQKEVEKRRAPRDVDRVDEGHARGKPYVLLKDGSAMNNNGTIHDKKGGTPNPSNKVKDWLKKHGWKTPE